MLRTSTKKKVAGGNLPLWKTINPVRGLIMSKNTTNTTKNQVAEKFKKYHKDLPFATDINVTGVKDFVRCACCRRWYAPKFIHTFWAWPIGAEKHNNVIPHCHFCVAFQGMGHENHMFILERSLEYSELTQPIVDVEVA